MMLQKSIFLSHYNCRGYLSRKSKDLTDYYGDIAAFYAKINIKEKLQKNFLKALSIVDEVNDIESFMALKNNYATFLSGNGRLTDAINIYEELIKKVEMDAAYYGRHLLLYLI